MVIKFDKFAICFNKLVECHIQALENMLNFIFQDFNEGFKYLAYKLVTLADLAHTRMDNI